MLSAVVVSVVSRKPGPGFYGFAELLGRLKAGDDREAFWNKERESAYEAWRRPLPKKPAKSC